MFLLGLWIGGAVGFGTALFHILQEGFENMHGRGKFYLSMLFILGCLLWPLTAILLLFSGKDHPYDR